MSKKGFTLFELLLVVALIGLFFIFITPNLLRKNSDIPKETNATELKKYLIEYMQKNSRYQKIKFVCRKNFSECVIEDGDGKVIEENIRFKIADEKSYSFYDSDMIGTLIEKKFDYSKSIIGSNKLFEFSINKKGYSDSFIVFDGKTYYVLDAIDENVKILTNAEDALKVFVKYDKAPINDSKYFFNE